MAEIYDKEDPTYYGIIPADVRYDDDLSFGARLMFAEFSALTKKDGFAYPSNKYLAKLYKVSTDTISRWINSLADKEYIYVRMVLTEDKKVLQRRIYTEYRNFKKDSQFVSLSQYRGILTGTDTLSAQEPIGIRINAEENNTSINNTRYNILSSNEDIDSNESIKEQKNKNIELNDNTDVNSVMNNIGMTKASDINLNTNKVLDMSWMNEDTSDKKDTVKKSNKSKRHTMTAEGLIALPEDKKTDIQKIKSKFLINRSKLFDMGKADTKYDIFNSALINQRISNLLNNLKVSVEDICKTLDYFMSYEWVFSENGCGYSLAPLVKDSFFMKVLGEMKSRQPEKKEFIPPVKRITRGRCSTCGNELAFDGTCPFCNLGV